MLHSLDLIKFRKQFPPFSDVEKVTDEQIELYWEMATNHIKPNDGPLINGSSLQLALTLMTAHLLCLSEMVGNNTTGSSGIITGSVVDKVQVQFAAPPFSDGWEYWMSQTPYGQQLLALFKSLSAGGFYFGGRPEKKPFRKVGGRF